MQQLIAQRQRAGFIGRGAERAAFRANFDTPPEDERHRFLFHVHGNAGVGKSFLLRELGQVAREHGALIAYVDDSAGSLPEAMEVISRQFATQGRRFKDLDRLLATYRERRHEAELAVAAEQPAEPDGPSASSTVAVRAGLVALGLVPGVGAFAGALDSGRLAQVTDRLRADLGARFRSHEDARLVLAPESVLTPVLLDELAQAASAAPWIVLFFDTYEMTGRFLDGWLHSVMTTDRYGAVPATTVVVTAGQLPFDTARWGGFGDFMTDLPLGPFTEPEARDLLAGRGVVAEPVVREVLRLTAGLPVLVSTLAESRPADPADVGDPSATAVDRFLKWEADPVRRSVALACALPRGLDADVFRAVADRPDAGPGELDALYAWLRSLPFVAERGGRLRYHDVVRAPMLRLQRSEAPRSWAARQKALAAVFGRWRTEAETGRGGTELWADEGWRELRLAELYHLLCAGDSSALSSVLSDVVDACEQGESVAGRWVRVLVEAGRDAETRTAADWGRQLAEALATGGTSAILELLLRRAGFAVYAGPVYNGPVVNGDLARVRFEWLRTSGDRSRERARSAPAPAPAPEPTPTPTATEPYPTPTPYPTPVPPPSWTAAVRPGAPVQGDARQATPADPGWSVTLDPAVAARAYRTRALAHDLAGDQNAAVADLDRALELTPDDARGLALRGEYHRVLERHDEAIRDLDRALALNPADAFAAASRGATRLSRQQLDEALADLDRAVELKPDYPWALVRRARVHRGLGDPDRQLADLDRAVAADPDWAWVRCERGDALRGVGRDTEALADYDHALVLEPGYDSARASRGASLANLGRHEEALAELDQVLERRPSYTWALRQRAAVRRHLGDDAGATSDEELAQAGE
nr:tetratricopeptide repeat protein [Streptomyces caeruleatus]